MFIILYFLYKIHKNNNSYLYNGWPTNLPVVDRDTVIFLVEVHR